MISVKSTFSYVNNLFFYCRMELAYLNMQTIIIYERAMLVSFFSFSFVIPKCCHEENRCFPGFV